MGSSSACPILTPLRELDDLDAATSKLIAELLLQDIAEISARRKGKARIDAPLSDEELAFRMQREIWDGAVRIINDHAMATSLNNAIDTDHRFLSVLSITERAAEDDRRAAIALSNGEPLPPQSNAQRLVEDVSFSALSEPLWEKSMLNSRKATQKRDVDAVTRSSIVILDKQSSSKGKARAMESKKMVPAPKIECTSCGDPIKVLTACLKAPCGHAYCGPCIADLIQAATRDESLYPPRCCSQPLPYSGIAPLLSPNLLQTFNAKRIEFDIPAANRIYCPTPTCSLFLGSSEYTQGDLQCKKCGIFVCSKCRQPAHSGDGCAENQSILELHELAKSEHWQTCPGCKAIVELHVGCYHMTCRCRFEFCYVCASPWKNCNCPQWDEDRLIETARHRVEQINVGMAPVAPLLFQERVHQMANTLRDNHDCIRHSWRREDGAARCEECRYRLPNFILVCRYCHLMACVRCARNRLA